MQQQPPKPDDVGNVAATCLDVVAVHLVDNVAEDVVGHFEWMGKRMIVGHHRLLHLNGPMWL